MKIKNININTILLLTVSTFMINGCVVKNKPNNIMHNLAKNHTQKVSWNNISRGKRNDCVNCYATAIKSTEVVSKIDTMDYSKLPSASNNAFMKSNETISNDKTIDTLHYDTYDYTLTSNDTDFKNKSYKNVYMTPQVSPLYSSRGNYSTATTAIQIGAFRRYAGAQIYVKKYNALSSRYNVTIKTGVKDNKPLHRVRIEGFSNRTEAKNFMARYGITDAFLVIK